MAKKKGKEQRDVAKEEAKHAKPEAPKEDEHAQPNRMSSFYVRTVTTLAMLAGFILLLFLGHAYCAGFVIFLLVLCFKELKALKRQKELDNKIPFFNTVNWYFFLIYIAFLLPLYLPNQTRFGVTDPTLLAIFSYHMLFSFCGFILGVLLFTLSLEKDTFYYQFKMLGWTLMILLVVVSQVCSLIYNTYKGMYWFIFPALCVVCNDIFAYIFGFFWGKTPLIKLSPKKTWEGFIGGALCTLIWAFIGSHYLTTIPALVCPQTRITIEPFHFPN